MTKRLPLSVALAAFAVACADATTPTTRTLVESSPAVLAITSVSTTTPPVPFGAVEVCKTSNVAGTFGFTVTTNAPTGSVQDEGTPDRSITIGAGGGTVCEIVYSGNTLGNVGGANTVTIVENAHAVPLTDISIVRYLHPAPTYDPAIHTNDTESEATRTAVVKINSDMSRRVTFTNTQPAGGEGCTPGFWKNNADKHDASQWGAVNPNATFTSIFGANDLPAGTTLIQALNLGGGGVNALARHAVAAYLNSLAGDPDYAFTTAQVIAKVQAAMASNNYETAKNELAAENERGCPLSQND